MRVLILGAGLMGTAAAIDMTRNRNLREIGLADADIGRLRAAGDRISDVRLITQRLDVNDTNAAVELFRGYDAVLSAVPYFHNLSLAECAVETGVNFCDLGGNTGIVESELALDSRARRRGITLIPDCGLAPGMANILAAWGIRDFDSVEWLRMRVGGLPQNPKRPLNYKLLFSAYGLINEYAEDAQILRKGQVESVPSLTGLEEISFPQPLGTMEAFYTSGGTSTLPRTLRDRVRNMDYKTIRYPGHCEQFRLLFDLGLACTSEVEVGEKPVIPRELLVRLLEKRLSNDDMDVTLVRIAIEGTRSGDGYQRTIEIHDYFDEKASLTSMMRMTAFPASIVAQMLAAGKIDRKGAIPQELCVPAEEFRQELSRRNIDIRISEGPVA